MKKTNKKENVELAQKLFELRAQEKAIKKDIDATKKEIMKLMGNDDVCYFSTYYCSINERSRSSLDKEKMVADGIELSKYEKQSFYKTLAPL